MATGVYSWSQTAASNASASSNIGLAEGMLPGGMNDACRAMMMELAKWRDDLAGVKPSNGEMITAGSANAQTLTTNGSIGALTNGWTITFKIGANLTNTAACTLAVDSLAAKQLQFLTGTNLTGGELAAGKIYTATYKQPADAWILHSAAGELPSGTKMLFVQTAAPIGWTKLTNQDDKALRLVSGTASTGGSTAFSSVFAARTIAQVNLPSYNLNHSLSCSGSTSANVSSGGYVATGTERMWEPGSGSGIYVVKNSDLASIGTHSHTFSGSVSGTVSLGGSGTAMDFAVQYVDVIYASKD